MWSSINVQKLIGDCCCCGKGPSKGLLLALVQHAVNCLQYDDFGLRMAASKSYFNLQQAAQLAGIQLREPAEVPSFLAELHQGCRTAPPQCWSSLVSKMSPVSQSFQIASFRRITVFNRVHRVGTWRYPRPKPNAYQISVHATYRPQKKFQQRIIRKSWSSAHLRWHFFAKTTKSHFPWTSIGSWKQDALNVPDPSSLPRIRVDTKSAIDWS